MRLGDTPEPEPSKIPFLSAPDRLHLPGFKSADPAVGTLGTKRNAQAVRAFRVDPQGDALSAVDENFDDAAVDEDPQFQCFVRGQEDGRGFGRAREHVEEDLRGNLQGYWARFRARARARRGRRRNRKNRC